MKGKDPHGKSKNMKPYYDLSTAGFKAFCNNMTASKLKAYKTQLALTDAQADAIAALAAAYSNSFDTAATAQSVSKAATQTRNTQRKNTTQGLAVFVDQWQSNPLVTPAILADLQLPVHKTTRTTLAPVAPVNLVATPTATGQVNIKWKRNGNSATTTFWLQWDDNGTWTTVYASTATKATLEDWPINTPATFRVLAVKKDQISGPSNTATIWGGSSSASLELAA